MKNISVALCLWALLFACQKQSPTEPAIIETATAVTIHAEYKELLGRCRKLSKTYEVYDACADAVDASFCSRHKLRCVDAGAP